MNSKEAALNYSISELCLGNAKKTIAVLEDLLGKIPEYPSAMGVIAAAYFVDSSKDKGMKYLDEMSKKGFDCVPALHDCAKRLISVGRTDYAILLLEAAVERNNADQDAHVLLFDCYKTRGDAAQS